jgi:hypothetical protein
MQNNSTQIRPGILKLMVAGLALVLTAGTVGSALTGTIGYVATALSLVLGVVGVYGALGRRSWGRIGIWGAPIVSVAVAALSIWKDGWVWGIAPVLLAGLGWFVARTMYGYFRPAGEMPAEVLARVEKLIVLSEESVAGVRVGARNDGAAIGIGYIAVGAVANLAETKAVRKFLAEASQARDVLRRSGGVEAAMIGVCAGNGIKTTVEGCTLVSIENLAWAVAEVKGPSVAEIEAVAAASGITLSREQLRMVERRQNGGKKNSGRKVVHQGRVTKVEK